jgi:hypothetical protein
MKRNQLFSRSVGLAFLICARTAFADTLPPQLTWDLQAVRQLARTLWKTTSSTSFMANAEFDGGCAGQDELARFAESSHTFLLFLEEKNATMEKTQKWFTPVQWGLTASQHNVPVCFGYSDQVFNGLAKSGELVEQIEGYYPTQSH